MSESSTPSSRVTEQLDAERFDWFLAVGGWRGMIESMVPLFVFLAAYTLTKDVWVPAIAAWALSAAFIIGRVLTRHPVTPAVSGLLVASISVGAALWTGKGENYFAWGLITTSVLTVAMIASVFARRPAAAYAVGMVWNLPDGWMKALTYQSLYSRCVAVTWVWVAMFVVRLAVQIPLWFTSQVELLATAKLVMGLPILAIVVWLSWMLLRPFAHLKSAPAPNVDR